MNEGTTFLIVGLISFLVPVFVLLPWWLKEVRNIGNERDVKSDDIVGETSS